MGKEVRQFLQALGISLNNAAAVIRQSRVTALADSASPADLAAVVADASGLGALHCTYLAAFAAAPLSCSDFTRNPVRGYAGYWTAEVTAAAAELAGYHTSLADVHAGIAAMVRQCQTAWSQRKLFAVVLNQPSINQSSH